MSAFWVLRDEVILDRLIQYLQSLPLGKGLKVYIEKPSKTPTQRAYFHCVCRDLATGLREQGHNVTEEDVKESIRGTLPKVSRWDVIKEAFVYVPPSTEFLLSEDYSNMIEKALLVAAHYRITLRDRDYYGFNTRGKT
jgi:hypothetical protein